MTELTAYCMKCKTQRPLAQARAVFTKSGQPAMQGACPVCGTTLYRMGATEAHQGMTAPEPAERPKRVVSKKKTAKKRAAVAKRTGKKATKPAARASAKAVADPTPRRRSGKLVIVESPAKAKTIENYLGKEYKVRASVGHVRDLLKSQLSVDIDNQFAPTYRVPNDKRDVVMELKNLAAGAKEVYLATDPDREGEAIAWHLAEAINLDGADIRRVTFHEITKDAVRDAFDHPRDINMDLVNAQQARRILDRLVGYELSPLLWEKVRPRLSAGRVQSVAVRLIVEREREIERFVPEEYWTIDAELARTAERNNRKRISFRARLVKIRGEETKLPTQGVVEPILRDLETAEYIVDSVKRGQRKRSAAAPFITSTLQQEASRRLGFNARRTMQIAQQLYEGVEIGPDGSVGLITYMRTDSTNISEVAQKEAARFVTEQYGKDYLPEKPNVYSRKAKGAQEAHEAIRPSSVFRTPSAIRKYLTKDQIRLYELIWQRFVASQMAAALYDTITVEVLAGQPGEKKKPYLFRCSGSTLRFAGFLAVYGDMPDEDNPADEDLGRIFPELVEGDPLDLLQLIPEQHFTQPPPRYSEATLVKALEEYGIGRPSTYAPIIQTIQERGYVEREGKRLIPTEIGSVVNDLLVAHFPEVVDVNFTVKMEDDLDKIASSEAQWVPVLREFYDPFKRDLEDAKANVPNVDLGQEYVGRDCPESGHPLIVRWGRFGKFIGCSNFPKCRYTEPWLEKLGITCPTCGTGEIVERKSKKGRTFYGCSRYPDCDWTSWKRPAAEPCPNCGGLLIMQNKEWAQCSACHEQVRTEVLPSLHSTQLEEESA